MMSHKRFTGIIKRALAGILVVGMVLTGMPVVNVEAANEIPEQTQPEQEIVAPEDPVEEPGGEDIDPGEEKPDDGTDESGETKPGDEDDDSGDDQGTEESQPETGDEETEPGEEEAAEDEDDLNAAYFAQVSANDISGNDLALYDEDEDEGKRVVGGYIELPEDRDVSVVDESARIYDYGDEIAPLMSDVLPEQYIPDQGTLPLTRSQNPYGSCWAHSAMALAEIDMMRNEGASSSVDYSELHLAYFSYNGAVNDPLGGLEGDSNTGLYDGDAPHFMDRGGNLSLAQNVLANWVGAADEKIAPYSQAANVLASGLSKELAFTDVVHLQNSYQINLQENPDIAKRMIQKYGGVGTSYCDADQYFNNTNKSYYCDTKYSTNHAVTIVGWDDTFSADKFGTKPEGDGAWLIRNSWYAGKDTDYRSRNTYFWMSYYDKSLAAGYAFDFEDADSYHHNYQYDGGMKTAAWGYGRDSIYAANVFTAKAYEGGERLEAVGLTFYTAQTPYTISIYKNLTNEANPESGTLIEEATTSGTCGCEGFYTISLANPVGLAEGDTFSVVVQYGAPEKKPGMVYLPFESSTSSWFRCETAAKKGQSFYKTTENGIWKDFGEEHNANLRIKAYTLDNAGTTGLPTKIELRDELKEGIAVGVGDTYQAVCTVLPRNASDKTVSWESDRPSVATVDKYGFITGVSDGTATITVTCTAEESVKASFSVEVYSDLRSIQITGASRVTAGRSLTLQTVRNPSSVPPEDLQWRSSDERVLTVDADGVVTGVAPGYAAITAGIGEVKAVKEITCEFPDLYYSANTSIEGITLTWSGGPGATKYEVYRAVGESWTNPELITTVTADGRDTYTYLDENVAANNKYIYKIEATVNYINGSSIEEKTVNSSLRTLTMPEFYSITYHLNGGENNSNNQAYYSAGYSYNYIYDAKSRLGYTFIGWYLDESLTQKLESRYLPATMTGNLDLYAGWTPVVYQITYRLNSGTNVADPITSYTIETDTFTLPEPTREGYRFDGWYTDSAFTKPITEVVKGSTGRLTVYAKWTEIRRKITYELDGGTNAADNPSSYTSADGYVSLKDPTKKGYDFQGWYRESTYETSVYWLSSSSVKEDITLYAKWELHTYKVTYIDGGTHGNPTSYTIEMPNISLQEAVKSGYRFAGWYTDSARTEPILEIKTDSCVNMTIYGKWEQIYSITYKLNGGVNDPGNPVSYVESDEITLGHPVKEGYTFKGWYTDAAFTSPISEIKGRRGNLTLYAKWEEISKKITYELDGGTNSRNNPSEYVSTTDFVLESPTKDGYDFQGWYTDSLLQNRITRITGSTTNGNDMTLYAKWSIHSYRITYMLYGGTNSAENPGTYTVEDDVIILKDAVKEGSTFEGWYSDLGYRQKVEQITPEDKRDITLFAKWQGEEVSPITAIRIKRPTRTTYKIGEALDVTGGEVICVSDTPMEPIPLNKDMIIGFDSSAPGICRVTVTLEDFSEDFETLIVEEPRLDALYGQRLKELTLPVNDYGVYSWADEEMTLNREGICNVPVSFIPNDKEAFQSLEDLYAQITVTGAPTEGALESGEITLQSESFIYTGVEQKPQVIVILNGDWLVEGRDYTITYHNNKDVGMATVVAAGIGDYYGSLSASFMITPAELRIRAKDKTLLIGETMPQPNDYEYEVSGLLADDRLMIEPVLNCDITEADIRKAGQFTIIPSAADAGPNYTITYEAGQLIVVSEYLVYSVVFDVQGRGTAPKVLYDVKAGSTIDKPEMPLEVEEDVYTYTFAGWCKDAACTKDWNFDDDIVQSDITLYARWLRKSAQKDSQFQLQEIEDIYYYTGKAWKPVVNVYDGETMLKAGRDYTVKYFNNINANAGGVWKKESGQGNGFDPDIPYVQIIGKGNYTDEVKVNFDIHPAAIADQDGSPADKVVLKYTDQFVAAPRKVLKPFGSIKYSKAMRLDQDYTLTLTAVDVRNDSGKSVPKGTMFDNAAIPAGYEGEFMLTVTGIGNYTGSISKSVHVTDKLHLMKNAKITLGKNQKNMELVGESVELTPSIEDSADTFTVKIERTILTPGQDYTVSYLDRSNERVGKATLVITGVGDYSGTKTAAFTVKGKAFTAGKITVTGIENKVYTGRAITQNGAVLVYNAGKEDERKLKYGKDYTISYAKNINKGTATMTFTGSKEAGFSGSFKKSFKISADSIDTVTREVGWDTIVAEYSREGARPVSEIVLKNAGGIRLQNGKDYTLSYKNNTFVAKTTDEKAPTIIVKGKGNYQGTFSIPFTITGADLRTKIDEGKITVKTTAAAYQPKKSGDYAYKPKVTLMEGKKALRSGADYTVTYIHNTQADYEAYIESVGSVGASAAAAAPQAVIAVGSDNTYVISGEPISVPLTIYRNKLTKANLDVYIPESECVYTGAQVRPEVVVYYKEGDSRKLLTKDRDYTVSYGDNVRSGKKAGRVTISGIGTFYGGDVTVNFEISRKKIKY